MVDGTCAREKGRTVRLLCPLLTPYDPTFLDPAVRLQGPSLDHPLGTDDCGRDIFSRVIYCGHVSLMIGVSVTLAAALIGSALGLASGFFPRLDTPIMRTLDGLMAFPSILLAIAIMASLGTSAINVFITLVVVYTPTIAHLVPSTTLVTRQLPFVESARSIGMTDSQVLLRLSARGCPGCLTLWPGKSEAGRSRGEGCKGCKGCEGYERQAARQSARSPVR